MNKSEFSFTNEKQLKNIGLTKYIKEISSYVLEIDMKVSQSSVRGVFRTLPNI